MLFLDTIDDIIAVVNVLTIPIVQEVWQNCGVVVALFTLLVYKHPSTDENRCLTIE